MSQMTSLVKALRGGRGGPQVNTTEARGGSPFSGDANRIIVLAGVQVWPAEDFQVQGI